MKSKATSTTLILLISIGIIVVVNYIVGSLGLLNFRADLTEKNIYTLSKGTRNIVSRLNPDEPVTIRFYATEDSRVMPQPLQNYATTVRDLLLEIEKESRGKVKLEKIDPRPSTAEEDKAIADDIQGYPGNDEQKFYLGLAIESVDKKEIIPLLNPNDEASLEYQIARAMAKISTPEKSRPLIGVMSSMPIAGPAMNFPGMPQQQPPPWIVIQHLRQDYDVREVPITADSIDADVKILLVIHPAGLSDKTQFAIDQFVLKGGKLIAFVDPNCLVTQAYNRPQQPMMGMPPPSVTSPSSDLPKLFKAWGINYDASGIVADLTYRMETGRGRTVATFLSVDRAGINETEPLTSSLEVVQMFSPGAFGIDAREGIAATRLIESSENSGFVDSAAAEKAQNGESPDVNPDGKKKVLGVRLTGTFHTAFPDGAPKDAAPAAGAPGHAHPPGETGGEDKKDAGAPAAAATADAPKKDAAPESLKKSINSEGMVFLFADVDMEYDVFALQRDQSGRTIPIPANSNIPLLLNAVEMASGGTDLVEVRSRAAAKREFTKMNELMAGVEAKYKPIVANLDADLQKIVQEISTLGGAKPEKGIVFLNPNKEQMRQLEAKRAEIQTKRRDAQKELNRDKDRLQMTITVLNMAAIPLIVILIGIVLAVRRHGLQAAH